MSGIYKITCIPTGKIYIGSAVDIKRRWSQHRHDLNLKKHSNNYLQKAWDKYGSDNFTFEVLEETDDKNTMFELEESYIKNKSATNRDIGFNMLDKCGKGRLGSKNSKEAIEKQRQKLIGRKLSPEHRKKIGDIHRGKKRPPEVIKKMWDTRKKLGKTKWPKASIDKIGKPLVALDSSGSIALRFSSRSEARRSGYSSDLIGHTKKGHLVHGYVWWYESELETFNHEKFFSDRVGVKSTTKKIYLDIETGVYYESQRELADALGLKTPTLNLQLKDGKHDNRYIEV